MRILFAAGGTAGHINPAIAVAQHLCRTSPDTVCLFAAVPGGMEVDLVHAAGFQTTEIRIQGLLRSFSPDNLRRIAAVPRALMRAKEILMEFHPDVVFATGGYLSFPIVWAASGMKIPCILHESNASAGMSMRLLSKKACMVLLNHPSAAETLPSCCKVCHVGNPLRAEFEVQGRAQARRMLGVGDQAFMILSFGGSLGAAQLNTACIDAYDALHEAIPGLIWHHASGRAKYEDTITYAKERNIHSQIQIHPYLDPIARYMAAADVIICRAGAVTLTELSALGKAAILIPYPKATGNHQTKNAEVFRSQGAAVVLSDHMLSGTTLSEQLLALWKHPATRKKYEENIHRLYVSDAVKKIVEIIKKEI